MIKKLYSDEAGGAVQYQASSGVKTHSWSTHLLLAASRNRSDSSTDTGTCFCLGTQWNQKGFLFITLANKKDEQLYST